ncbi:MAG: thioredoxin-disulfide reductase, partial [Candidatus Omnitrophota bacterium]
MSENIYDLIIVGAGPAGLTAGIYASRRKLKNLIISKNIGGQAALVGRIENYPGFMEIEGVKLTDLFCQQAEKFGSKVVYEEVLKIKNEKNKFFIQTDNQTYQALTLILAFGVSPRRMDVPGEVEFTGRGVTYCANCDGPLYKNKVVAVVGGGNSALDAAEYLSKIAKQVYLIHRRNYFKGDEILEEKVKYLPNVELVLESMVTKIEGEKFVKSLEVKNVKTEAVRQIEISGVFVEIGHHVAPEPIKDLVKMDKENQIIVDNYGHTSEPGIFAAGDLTSSEYKQIIIAAGEGAKAALSAY